MTPSSLQRRHDVFRSILLLSFACYIASLVKSDSLHYYLAPRMEPWIRYCPVAMGFMAVFLFYRAVAREIDPSCGCEHPVSSSWIKNSLVYGLFLLPLTLGWVLPDRALGVSAAVKKGFSYSSPLQTELYQENVSKGRTLQDDSMITSGTPSSADKLSSNTPSKIFTAPDAYNAEFAALATLLYNKQTIQVNPDIYSETIGAIELFKQDFKGHRIELTGFVYRDSPTAGAHTEFAVGRFLVLCCTADALPFGVLVAPPNGASLQNGGWVRVHGTLDTQTVKGKEVLKIDADKIENITAPAITYVYPNADSVKTFKQESMQAK